MAARSDLSLSQVVDAVRRRDALIRSLMLLAGIALLALGGFATWLYFTTTPLWFVVALVAVYMLVSAPRIGRARAAHREALRGVWSQAFRHIVVEEDGVISRLGRSYLILLEDGILIRRSLPTTTRGKVEHDVVRFFPWEAIATIEYVAEDDSWTTIEMTGPRIKIAPAARVDPHVAGALSTLGVAVPSNR